MRPREDRERRDPIAILHERVAADAAPDARDVLVQVAAVSGALHRLGWTPVALPCDLDFGRLEDRLAALCPAVVFNLVEALDGQGRLIARVPELLDALDIPYTGAPSEALRLASNKIRMKQRLQTAGLPTPAWWRPPTDAPASVSAPAPSSVPAPASFLDSSGPSVTSNGPSAAAEPGPGRYIIKHASEDASFGLDDTAVVWAGDAGTLEAALAAHPPGDWFAERYVEGRELNLSLLADGPAVRVLPPAEIVFDQFPPDKPRIVGYRAKWDQESFEYRHTLRRFDFPAEDDALLAALAALARECWRLLGLRGYARVDFRVDRAGRAWILEANANPCLSPDAGFAAAVDRAGLSFDEGIAAIVAAARPGAHEPAPGRLQGR